MPTSASVEVHVLDVGQGDSVLVVTRNLAAVATAIGKAGKTAPADAIDWVPFAVANNVPLAGTIVAALLVDGGDDQYGSDVVAYLETHGVVKKGTVWSPALSVLLSHFHDDHMAGLRSVFRVANDPPKTKPPKTPVPPTRERYRPKAVYVPFTTSATEPVSERYRLFSADVAAATSAKTNKTTLVQVQQGGIDPATKAPLVIGLGSVGGIDVTVRALAAAQGVYDPATKKVVQVPSLGKVTDQNDRSIVLVLEYGSFRCFLGGDIAGNGLAAGGNVGANAMDAASKAAFSQHADVESRLRPAMRNALPKTTKRTKNMPKYPSAGYCTVMKANHHGSSSSVDVNLLATLRPVVLAISSGVKARFHNHPTQAVMNRVLKTTTSQWFLNAAAGATVSNSLTGIYVTEIAERYKGKAFATTIGSAVILGDVVIRPVDEDVATIQNATAATLLPLRVHVYGTGDQTGTGYLSSNTTLRATAQKAKGTYPLGPFWHSDSH